jgi:Transposase, Mutator family
LPTRPSRKEHWRGVRTYNPLKRILREVRRSTRIVGAFPDGQSAPNLAAKLRHIAGTAWSSKHYLNIELLKDQQMRGAITARDGRGAAQLRSMCEKHWTLPNLRLRYRPQGKFLALSLFHY